MHERDSMDRSMPAKLEKGQPMPNLESHEKTATRPLTGTVPPQSPISRIARRSRGQSHGPITRLMSPSDFGHLLKPFVFLDVFDTQGRPNPFAGFGLHPHSGIATLTYVAEGSIRYEDTNGATGLLPAGGLEWMRAGGGVWHGGGAGEPVRTRGFQLWVALPPELEVGPSESVYLGPERIPSDGPARVLLGSYGTATSAITAPSPMNYLEIGRGRSTMNVARWIVQGLLAALFLFAGSAKLVLPLDQMAGPVALPGWFLRFIGVAEVLGALGLVLPGLLRI